MADEPDQSEKTEEPTQKRLDDALEKGDVAKSQEVSTWFVLAAATLMIAMLADNSAGAVTEVLAGFLSKIQEFRVDSGTLRDMTVTISFQVLLALALPFFFLAVAAVVGNLVQHRLVFSLEPVKPKLSKISPLAGFKRLFGSTSLVNFAKGIAKLGIVGTGMFLVAWPDRDIIAGLITADPTLLLETVRGLALKVLGIAVAIMAVVAVMDYAYQRYIWNKKQRMTMKEVKDEFKQMEGDPHVRAKIRQIRNERGRKRMMADVPQASVVITNPTHFAVALKYETGMSAPICVAKGTDRMALKIREIAKHHDIPVIENPPLARALHSSIDVDSAIPPEHYRAVAEVIGYVMKLRAKSAWKAASGR